MWRLLSKSRCLAAVVLVFVALAARVAEGQQPPASCPGGATLASPRFGEFFDALLPQQLSEYGIPGAVVLVVHKDKVAFAKGYGVADVAAGVPVNPDRTIFRLASISKVFTWMVALKLAEEGKVDLHTDVNHYLDGLQIPATYPEPITLHHLITHTAGLENGFIGLSSRSEADVLPLRSYLERFQAARVRPVGSVSAYSNYGAALAGYVVERAAGVPYDQLVEDQIFKPLGMKHTTMREPLPPELASDLATSYERRRDGAWRPSPFVFSVAHAESSLTSTAADMGRWLLALLRRDPRVFGEAVIEGIYTQRFAHHPSMPGSTHALFEGRFNQTRTLLHTGGCEGFTSVVTLVPEADLGLFLAYNGLGGREALNPLRRTFADCYFPPAPLPPLEPSAELVASTPSFAGEYRPTRGLYRNLLKGSRQLQAEKVVVVGPGELRWNNRTWVAEAPGVFRAKDVWARIAFRHATADEPAYLFAGFGADERVPWYETTRVQLTVLGGAVLGFLITLAGGLVGWIRRRRRRAGGLVVSRLQRWSDRVALASAGVNVAFLVTAFSTDISDLVYGLEPKIYVVLLSGWLCAVLTVVTVVLAALCWRRVPRFVSRSQSTLIVLADGAFLWWLYVWNLWPTVW